MDFGYSKINKEVMMNWLKALSGRDTKVQAQMLPKTTYQSLRGNKVEINKQLKRAAPLYFIIDKISRETSRSTFILNEAKYRFTFHYGLD